MIQDLAKLQEFLSQKEYINSKKFILIDDNTYNYCLAELIEEVDALNGAEILEIESSEKTKSLEIVQELALSLIESQADRSSILICLGGGVICDIGGFLASVFKRGIPHILIPTTLLAMVDASIGGKTGVNLNNLKNQIGSFYNPVFTSIHIPFLDTLSQRHILNGAAEILKISLLKDNGLFEKIINSSPIGEEGYDEEIIFTSIKLKQEIVESDPKEKGYRKILNLGHSLGHAFESIYLEKEEDLLHGEAVASGLYYSIKLSEKLLGFPERKANQIYDFIEKYYKIIPLKENLESILNYLSSDKKNIDNEFCFVLLKDIGNPIIDYRITKQDLIDISQQ